MTAIRMGAARSDLARFFDRASLLEMNLPTPSKLHPAECESAHVRVVVAFTGDA